MNGFAGQPDKCPHHGVEDSANIEVEALETCCCDLEQRRAVLEAEARRRAGERALGIDEARALLKERLLAKLDDAEKAYDAGEYVDGNSFIADVKVRYSL